MKNVSHINIRKQSIVRLMKSLILKQMYLFKFIFLTLKECMILVD